MDKNNFSEIYKKYVMTAYSAAMQVVHNEADADDIAQETMVKLYLNIDALKDHDESGYYITREIKVHERSEKEVASEMGITIGNLRVKMTRTKKWLCQHFADKAREMGFL